MLREGLNILGGLKNNIYAELKKYWLNWGIALVVLSLFLLLIFEHRAGFLTPKPIEHTVVSQHKAEELLGEITGDTVISQTFIAEKDFSQIQIPFGTYGRLNEGILEFELKEHTNDRIIYKRSINVQTLVDGVNLNIEFPRVTGGKGTEFVLSLVSKGLKNGKTVTVWKSSTDAYPSGKLTINGKDQVGDLRFSAVDIESKPLLNKTSFLILAALLLSIFLLSIIALRRFKDQVHKAFLITVIPIGLMMVVIFPPFDQLDEIEHFPRAFEISEGRFLNQSINHELGNYLPASLFETMDKVRYVHQQGYKYSIVNEAFGIKLNPETRVFKRNYAAAYPPLVYIPQSLGIIAGKTLFQSPLLLMYFGRIFNLLAYIALIYMALKIVPVKKTLFYGLALIPMAIIQASSLSADAVINSTALLFVSYILHLSYGRVETVKTRNIMILLILGLFITLSKVVYFPMLLLFLLIPCNKFKNKKDYFSRFAFVLAVCVSCFIVWNLLNISNLSVPDLRGGAGVSPKDQVKFVLSHPLRYTKIIVDTVLTEGPTQLVFMVGKVATNYSYSAPGIVVNGFIFLLILLGIINNAEDVKLNNRKIDRLIFLATFLAVLVLIYTALYVVFTNVGAPVIAGIHGRYFIPIAALFFLSLSRLKLLNFNRDMNFLVFTLVNSAMYALVLKYIFLINNS